MIKPIGDLRTISNFYSSLIDDLGRVILEIGFTDESAGIFISDLVSYEDPDSLPGDINKDGTVDAADYVVWRKNGGTQLQYDAGRASFGSTLNGSGSALQLSDMPAVPEPHSFMLFVIGVVATLASRRRR